MRVWLVITCLWGSVLCSCALKSELPPPAKSDAIVLLAGSYGERAPAAAQLYRDGFADRVVLTNDGVLGVWSARTNRNLYQIEWAAEELIRLGVPRERIILLPYYSSGTVYDSLAVRCYFLEHDLRSMIIVTSDYHMRRALWIFGRVFTGYPVKLASFASKSPSAGLKYRAQECLKTLYYRLKYGMLGLVPDLGRPTIDSGRQK